MGISAKGADIRILAMTAITILLALTTAFFWWRKRVWKRRYRLALHPLVAKMVKRYMDTLSADLRDAQRTEDWPEEIDRR